MKMKNSLKALKWRIERSLEGRAKYEAWKYNTFGPGREVYGRDYAYQIIDCGELQDKLSINDPSLLAGLASIIAEMEWHKEIAFREPRVMPRDRQEALKKIQREEDVAIDRVVQYLVPDNLQPQRYVERYEETGEINRFSGLPVTTPIIRVTEPDIPRYRKEHRKMFRDMLEKLKHCTNTT
jgi:hypothetical protein